MIYFGREIQPSCKTTDTPRPEFNNLKPTQHRTRCNKYNCDAVHLQNNDNDFSEKVYCVPSVALLMNTTLMAVYLFCCLLFVVVVVFFSFVFCFKSAYSEVSWKL